MKFQMFFKVLIPIFISFIISACSVSTVNKDGSILDILNIKKEKIIEYKREAVSENLINTVSQIIEAMNANNLTLINQKFIHPTFGFYEVYKDDKENKISLFQKKLLDEISDDIDSFDIKEEEVNFNCSPNNDAYYGWDKEGVFLTPDSNINLSQLMIEENLIFPNKYIDEDIKRAMVIEKTSYKVIIPYNIIFYITKIEEQWFITLIDNITTNCS